MSDNCPHEGIPCVHCGDGTEVLWEMVTGEMEDGHLSTGFVKRTFRKVPCPYCTGGCHDPLCFCGGNRVVLVEVTNVE